MKKKLGFIGVGGLLIMLIVFFGLFNPSEKTSSVKVKESNFQSLTINDTPLAQLASESNVAIPESFELMAENEQLQLYLEADTLAILVKDKSNQFVWSSYDTNVDFEAEGYSLEIINYIKSGVSIMTYDRNTPGRRTVLDSGVDLNYSQKEDGFTAHVDFTAQQLRFDLSVTIQGGDLLVHVPIESVEEYNPKLWQPGNNNISLNQLVVFPFLGSTEGEENGYTIIPDGVGAIVHLDETPKSTEGYTAAVYGRDFGYENNPRLRTRNFSSKPLEHVSLPIYGVIQAVDERGVLVIAENGESYATYNYRPKNTDTKYYQYYFTYNYRTAYAQFQSRVNEDQHVLGFQETVNSFDLVQRYVFLNEDQANYVGVAKNYRKFLELQSDFIPKENTETASIPLKIDFINNEVKMGTLGVEDVTLTSYAQVVETLQELQTLGYEHLDVTLKTFLKSDWIYSVERLSSLGGKAEYENMIDFLNEQEIPFQYYSDYTKTYFNSTSAVANKMNRSTFTVLNPENGLLNYINHPKAYVGFAQKDVKKMQDLAIDSLAIGGLNTNLFTHYDKSKVVNRLENMAYTEQMIQYFHENGIKTSMYAPNAYLYPLLDKHFDTPIQSSGLSFVDETVPLIPLILSGHAEMFSVYLNNASNDQDTLLKLIEFGVYPSFLLTAESAYYLKDTASSNITVSELAYLENRMATYYEGVNEVLQQVATSEMIDHRQMDEGIIKVTYSNGKSIWLNYNQTDYHEGELFIEGKGVLIQ